MSSLDKVLKSQPQASRRERTRKRWDDQDSSGGSGNTGIQEERDGTIPRGFPGSRLMPTLVLLLLPQSGHVTARLPWFFFDTFFGLRHSLTKKCFEVPKARFAGGERRGEVSGLSEIAAIQYRLSRGVRPAILRPSSFPSQVNLMFVSRKSWSKTPNYSATKTDVPLGRHEPLLGGARRCAGV